MRGFVLVWALQLALLSTAACAPLPDFSPGTDPAAARTAHEIHGRVVWPEAERKGQATIGDIALAATVSLVDTSTNPQSTVASTVTRLDGSFDFNIPNFIPAANRVYLLEATKGLGGQALSWDAPRLRTFIKSVNASWQPMHADGLITISPASTALAIMQSGYATAGRTDGLQDPGTYIGIITQIGDPYDSVGPAVDTTTFRIVVDLVRLAIENNTDSVNAINYNGTSFGATIGTLPALTDASPRDGSFPGSRITLYGRNLSTPTGVTIGGKACRVDGSTATSVDVTLPFDATTGPIVASYGAGSTAPYTYSILTPVSGRYKPAN